MVKTYEVMLILPVKLRDEEQDAAVERVVKEIERVSGEVIAQRKLGRKAFARPMKKQESGFYNELDANLDTSAVSTLTARLRLLDNLLRFRVILQNQKEIERRQVKAEHAVQVED